MSLQRLSSSISQPFVLSVTTVFVYVDSRGHLKASCFLNSEIIEESSKRSQHVLHVLMFDLCLLAWTFQFCSPLLLLHSQRKHIHLRSSSWISGTVGEISNRPTAKHTVNTLTLLYLGNGKMVVFTTRHENLSHTKVSQCD